MMNNKLKVQRLPSELNSSIPLMQQLKPAYAQHSCDQGESLVDESETQYIATKYGEAFCDGVLKDLAGDGSKNKDLIFNLSHTSSRFSPLNPKHEGMTIFRDPHSTIKKEPVYQKHRHHPAPTKTKTEVLNSGRQSPEIRQLHSFIAKTPILTLFPPKASLPIDQNEIPTTQPPPPKQQQKAFRLKHSNDINDIVVAEPDQFQQALVNKPGNKKNSKQNSTHTLTQPTTQFGFTSVSPWQIRGSPNNYGNTTGGKTTFLNKRLSH